MRRLLPALLIAVLVHATVLTAETDWLRQPAVIAPRTRVITMQLAGRVPVRVPAIRTLPDKPPGLPPIPKTAVARPPISVKRKAKAIHKATPRPRPVVRPQPDTPRPPPLPVAHPASLPTAAESDPQPPAPAPVSEPSGSAAPLAPHPDAQPPADATANTAPGTGQTVAVVVATPRYHDNPPPDYPVIARRRGYEGTVVLEVYVNADGTVGDLRIVQSSRHRLLDRSAVKAVRNWQFEPGRQADRILAMWVRVPVDFRLQ